MVDIFEHTCHRKYLKEYFNAKKAANPNFSHRYLCTRLGLKTSNLLMLIMQGKRNLTPNLAKKISIVFEHNKKEASYFENMVGFVQSKSAYDRELHFKQMTKLRKNLKVDKIPEQFYDYYSNWYNLIMRELVINPEFKSNPEVLAKKIIPKISIGKAKKSIDLLRKMGFIRKVKGRYVQDAPFKTTGPEVSSLAVYNFHKDMAHIAADAIEKFPKHERNNTACTVQVSEEGFNKIKDKIANFRKEILSEAEADKNTNGQRVYQMNFQLFPMSVKPPKRDN